MERLKKDYLIQRLVKATNVSEALANEQEGEIVEVVRVFKGNQKQIGSYIGFTYNTAQHEKEED